MVTTERTWTLTRDQLIDAIANIEIRGIKATGPMAGKAVADDFADAILHQIPDDDARRQLPARERPDLLVDLGDDPDGDAEEGQ